MIKLLAVFLAVRLLVGCSSQNVPIGLETASSEGEEKSIETQEKDNLEIMLTSSEEQNDQMLRQLKMIEAKMRSSGDHYLTFFTSDLYLKASRSAIEGDLTLSLSLFRYLQQLYPQDLFLQKRLAIALIRVGKISEALIHLKEVYAKGKFKDEKIGLLLAGVYGALSDKKNARLTYKKILRENPKSEDGCLLLSKNYFEDQDVSNAQKVLDDCEKAIKVKGIFDYHKGAFYNLIGDSKKAIYYLEKAMKSDSDNYLAFSELGQIYEDQKEFKKALSIYEAYCLRDPSKADILNKIIKILFTLERFQESVPYLKILSSIENDNLNVKMKLGMIYIDSGNYEEAKNIFLEILREVPSSDKVLFYLGSVYALTQELEKSLFLLKKIEKESSFYKESSLQMIKILSFMALQKPDYEDELIVSAKEYSEEIPEIRIDIAMILASYYELKEEYSKAISLLDSLRGDERYKEGHDYYLATLYEKNNQVQDSRNLIAKIIEKNPKNAQAWNFLGYSLLEEGENLDLAYEHIQKAIKIEPDDAFIRDSLGWYYYKNGKYSLALKEVLYAYKKIGDDHVVFKHLALIYRAMRKNELAKKYFLRAKETAQNEKDRNELVQIFDNLEKITETERFPASQK